MNRITAILLIVFLLLMLGMYWYIRLLEIKVEKGKEYESLYYAGVKENKVWKDKENQWRNKAQVGTARPSILKEDPLVKEMLKEFTSIKKSLKNLESLTSIQSRTISQLKGAVTDTVYTIITGRDTSTVKAKKITASNEWNNYDITIIGDSADIKREGREEFDTAVYWERLTKKGNKTIWPFGQKTYSSEIVSKNPETMIVNQNSLIVKRKK